MTDQKRSKELLKGTGIYAVGEFGTKILSFIIVPLYTYYIAAEDMGIYDLLMSTIQLLSPIITMQISDAAYRWIIRDEGSTELYLRTTLQVLIFNCTVAAALVFSANRFVSIPYCSYFAILLVLTRIFSTLQKLLRALKNQKLFAFTGILYSVVFLSLNVIFICILRKGISSMFISGICATIITSCTLLLAEPRMRINCFKKPSISTIREFYRFSIPLVPNYLNWWVINSSDRYIVAFFLGISSNGILAVAHKFPTVLQTMLNLFTSSWQDLSVAENDDDTGTYYTKVFRLFYLLALSGVLIIIPLTKVIVYYIMSEDYKQACDCIAFYYLGTVFQSFSSFYGAGYLRSKNTSKAFSSSIYGAIVNAVVNLLIIRFVGLQAAAISTFVGFLVMWLIREKQNRKNLGIVINVPEFTLLTTMAVVTAVASILTAPIMNLFIALACAVVVLVLNRKNIVTVMQMLKKRAQ